jgi:hypothetical protein
MAGRKQKNKAQFYRDALAAGFYHACLAGQEFVSGR